MSVNITFGELALYTLKNDKKSCVPVSQANANITIAALNSKNS